MLERIKVINFWLTTPSWRNREIDYTKLPKELLVAVLGTHNAQYFDIPSENVSFGNVRPTVQQGRCWKHWRRVGTGSSEHPREDGTISTSTWTVHNDLIEVYEDRGDDGHVDYQLIGYAEISEENLSEFLRQIESAERRYDYPQLEIGEY